MAVPAGRGYPLKDVSVLRPPKGVKVAIIEWDDLECAPCARAVPLIERAAQQYRVPVVHYDFPIWEQHRWTLTAAVTARYLKDSVSPKLSADFRRDVFSAQNGIASPEDFLAFRKRWFEGHKLRLPSALDGNLILTNQVKADRELALRVGLKGTPSIFVVTSSGWTQVMDPALLGETVAKSIAQVGK